MFFTQKTYQLFLLLSPRRDQTPLNSMSIHLPCAANPDYSQQHLPFLLCFTLQPKAHAVSQGCGFSLIHNGMPMIRLDHPHHKP